MNSFLKIIFTLIKWIFIILILLFALATFMGKSYLQTLTLVLIAISLAYWPIKKKLSKAVSISSRVGLIIILVLINIICFKPEPKSSIYLSDDYKKELYSIYNKHVSAWPEGTEDIYLDTKYGKVHILACGDIENPPIMLIHAASMGAHSWAENLDPIFNHYRIYSFDNIGEGNKSELNDATKYPKNGKELADLYASMANELGIESCPVFGASNGGFVAQSYAFHYPEKVKKLALFGPMGLTQLSGKSIAMLSIASIYPFKAIREHITKWALGENEYINKAYGEWFNCILRGTIPSLALPVPLKKEQKEQKQQIELPILLFLGTKDAIVGDAEIAKLTAKEYPNIQIEILESGHLIAVEHAESINREILKFLNIK